LIRYFPDIGEFDRLPDEVEQNLREPAFAPRLAQLRRNLDLEADLLFLCQRSTALKTIWMML